MTKDLSSHPCFNDAIRHLFGRVHLPVAPRCNIQCRFCSRKHDCVNESRPGVTSAVLSPGQAMAYLDKALDNDSRIRVVGIAGPGDPLANAESTFETLRRVRAKYPEMLLCLATNGLNLPFYADEIARLEVSHVTVTVNAVDPVIGEKIYAWVRDEKNHRTYRGIEGARLLLERQLDGIRRLKAFGVTVKINTILIPGVNDDHIEEVARETSELGADLFNCIPIYPVADSEWGDSIPASTDEMVMRVRKSASQYISQMHHCTRCRADAVGILGEDDAECPQSALLRELAGGPLEPEESRPFIAIGSMEGVLVNQHLGECERLWIYGKHGEGFRLIDTRPTPEPGGGQARWEALAEILKDCRAILVSGAGESPRAVLSKRGIRVIEMEGLIEPALEAVFEGREVRAPKVVRRACGSSCSGNGTGCG
jgi:nitrogen fixation protein NifB